MAYEFTNYYGYIFPEESYMVQVTHLIALSPAFVCGVCEYIAQPVWCHVPPMTYGRFFVNIPNSQDMSSFGNSFV